MSTPHTMTAFHKLAQLLAPATEAPLDTLTKLVGQGAVFDLNHNGYLVRTATGYRLATYAEKPDTFLNPECKFYRNVGELAELLAGLPRDWDVYVFQDQHMPAEKPLAVMAQTGFMVRGEWYEEGPGKFLSLEEFVAQGCPTKGKPCVAITS